MRINDRFSIERDPHNFIVVETIQFKDKDGNDKTREVRRYCPDLKRACLSIIKHSTDFSGDVNTLLLSIDLSTEQVVEAINNMREKK